MENTIKEEIRTICIYHSDDGTSGYKLNEYEFNKIFNLLYEQYQKGAKDMLELISKGEAWNITKEYYHKKFFKELNL